MPCTSLARFVPYFKEYNQVNDQNYHGELESLDAMLYDHFNNLHKFKLNFEKRSYDDNPDVQAIPDAVFKVREAGKETLDYEVRVNDNRMWHYHRNNGFTKMSI